MKKLISSTCFLFAVSLLAVSAEPRHFNSKVSEVTVYLRGAMIKRMAHVNLQQGNNEIILDGLSNSLDINSVKLESSSSITILSVNAATNYLEPERKTPEEIELTTNLDTLNQRIDKINNEIKALEIEMDMLTQNYKIAISTQGFYADALENTADFYDHRVKDVLNDITALGYKKKDLTTRKVATQAQLTEIQGKSNSPHGEITINALSPGYADADFTFSYYVNGAGWAPTYNMRAENDSSNIVLDYDADVYQTSGEDWDNVNLILSTGNPSISGVKPSLTVNQLDFDNPNNRVYYAAPSVRSSVSGNSMNNSAEVADKVSAEQKPATDNASYAANYTIANQNILATVFNIDLQYNIPSDGISKHVRIQEDTLHAKFSYAATPKLSTEAFLEADITGWEAYNLLPGSVNIFLENSFVGKSYINPSITKDTLTVSFGRDNRINIKRVRVKDFTRNQFLGSSKIQSFGYQISVKNTKASAIDIKIEDQIPVSTQKDIEITLLQSSGAELDDTTGTLTWRMALQPGDDKSVTFEYTVKYPKGKKINL